MTIFTVMEMKDNEMREVRRATDPVRARSSSHQACIRCHEKKLRCSGERDGCKRCIATQLPCEYSRTRRAKKGPRSPDASRSHVSAPASASSSTPEWPSPESSRGAQSLHAQTAPINSTPTSHAHRGGIFGQFSNNTLSTGVSYEASFQNGRSLPQPGTTISASPSSYSTSYSDPAPVVAFSQINSQSYPLWPSSSAYDAPVPESSSQVLPFAPGGHISMPSGFESASTYPIYYDMDGYPDKQDYSAINPGFWPPSTEPGP